MREFPPPGGIWPSLETSSVVRAGGWGWGAMMVWYRVGRGRGCPKAGIIWPCLRLRMFIYFKTKEFLELNPKPSLPSIALQSRLSPNSPAYLISFCNLFSFGNIFWLQGFLNIIRSNVVQMESNFIFSTRVRIVQVSTRHFELKHSEQGVLLSSQNNSALGRIS